MGITVARYDFSEPQQGKVVCDRVLFQKIKQFSELHNFRYEESEIRVWKAYAVGVGRLIPWQSLYIRHQGCTNISLMEGKGFFTNTEIRDFHRPRNCQASKDDVEIDDQPSMFVCPEEGCN